MLALSLFPPLLATLAMAKEGEQKTILQVYVSSISAHEFLLGKDFDVHGGGRVRMSLCCWRCCSLTSDLVSPGDPTPFIVATILYAFCIRRLEA